MKILYLIRGLPGSGKSTLADKIYHEASCLMKVQSYSWFEANQYRMRAGEYFFDPEETPKVHEFCIEATEKAMAKGVEVVIVSNTFIRRWELSFYEQRAKHFGYQIVEIICKGNFANVHNVPEEVIGRMKRNFEF